MAGKYINVPDDYKNSVADTTGVFGQALALKDANNAPTGDYQFTGRIETGLSQGRQDADLFKVTLGPGVYSFASDSVTSDPLSRTIVGLLDKNGNVINGLEVPLVSVPGVETAQYFTVTESTDFYVKVFSSCCVCVGNYAFQIREVSDKLVAAGDAPSSRDGALAINTAETPITGMPTAYTGTIDYIGDVDYYKVNLQPNKDYLVTIEGYDDGTRTDFVYKLRDPKLSIRDVIPPDEVGGAQIEYDFGAMFPDPDFPAGGDVVVDANASFADYVNFYLPSGWGGDYYLRVSGGSFGTGDYKITIKEDTWRWEGVDDHADSRTYAKMLTVDGTAMAGRWENPSDEDFFKVNLQAGVTYIIRQERTAGLIDPYLQLFDAKKNLVTENDDKGADPFGTGNFGQTANDALIMYTPKVTGTYYLNAWGQGVALGDYNVSVKVWDDAEASSKTIQRVVVNRTAIEGQIEIAGDSDWYGIYLSSGATYEFKANQASAAGLSNPLLTLRDHDGEAVAFNDDAIGLNASIRFTAGASGMYYLDVQDSGAGTGRYQISASAADDFAAGISTTGMVDLDSSAGEAGRINFGGDVDWLQIDLERGDDYIIRLQGVESGGGLTLADPRLLGVYDSEGVLVHNSGNDDFGNSRNAYVRFTPAETARYYLAVAGSTLDDLGSYRVAVERETENDVDGSAATRSVLTVGATVSSNIDANGDKDWYSVSLVAGQTYVFDLLGDTTSTQVLRDPIIGGLYDANGTLLADTSNNNYGASLNSRMLFTAATGGTYFIEAKGNVGHTGAYQLKLKDLEAITDTVGDALASHGTLVLIQNAGTINGSVDVARDVDWYAVNFQAGVMYDITLRGAASGMGSLLDPRLWGIYDSTGQMIMGTGADAGDGGTDVRTNFLAQADGTYYLAAGGTADMTGTYRLEVRPAGITDDVAANASTTATLVSGTAYEGQIETIGDKDWVRVDLTGNSLVTLRMDAMVASLGQVSMPVIANVFDAKGEAVYLSPSDTGTTLASERTFTTLQAGTYYVELRSFNEGIGGYRLQVTESLSSAIKAPELMGSFIDYDPTLPQDIADLPHYSTNLAVDGVITLKFAKPVLEGGFASVESYIDADMRKGSGKISIMGGGQNLEIDVNSSQVQVSGDTITINPDVAFLPDTEYVMFIDAGAFTDATGVAFAGIGVERSTTHWGLTRPFPFAPFAEMRGWVTETINDPNEFVFKTAPLSTETPKDDWTLMVYMAADNELEGQALADLQEIFAVQMPDNVNVVVMVDRAAGYDLSAGNWTGSYRGLVQSGMSVADIDNIDGTGWESLGEVNTGDAKTLSDFVNWAKSNYASKNYGLVVWGPGGGTNGMAWDHSAGLDSLSLKELRTALTTAGATSTVTGVPTTDNALKLLDAELASDGRQVVLSYNQAIYDLTSSTETYGGHEYHKKAFEYSLDGTNWSDVVAWDVQGSAIRLDLGLALKLGEAVQIRFNSAYRPEYAHLYDYYNPLLGDFPGQNPSIKNEDGSLATETFGAIRSQDKTLSADSFTITLTDNKLNLLAFDSSLMGLTETLWEVRDNTHQLVASEDIIPATGFNYRGWLASLADNPQMPGSELARKLVYTYFDQNAGGISASMAAYNVDNVLATQNDAGVASLLHDLNAFADFALISGTVADWEVIHEAARNGSTTPTHDAVVDYFRDLTDFLQYLWVYLPYDDLWQHVNATMRSVEAASTVAKTMDSGSVGLGIYMPIGMPRDPDYTADNYSFLSTTWGNSGTPKWDEFIDGLQRELVNRAPTTLTLTPETTTREPGHVAELTSMASQYRLTADLRVATISYDDDAWTSANELALGNVGEATDSRHFTVIGDGLYLKRGTILDYEFKSSYTVHVTLSDPTVSGSTPLVRSYTVTIDNLDERAPLMMSASTATRVAEGSDVSRVVYKAEADDDIGVSYSLKAVGDHAAFIIDADDGEVRFKTSPDYEAKDIYTFTVLAEDAVGNRAEKQVKLRVTNVDDGDNDTRGPVVMDFSPTDNGTKVALNSDIRLTFNEQIQFKSGKVVLKTFSGSVIEEYAVGSSKITIANDVVNDEANLTINPGVQLANNTMYVVDFKDAVIEDQAGNQMADFGVYNFRTIAGIPGVATGHPDTDAPTVSSTNPLDGAVDVAVASDIVLTFNEAIQRGVGLITIRNSTDNALVEAFDAASSERVTIVNSVSEGKYTLTINPTDNLNVQSEYVVELEAGVVRDAAGNGNVQSGLYHFTTSNTGQFSIQYAFDPTREWTDAEKLLFEDAARMLEEIIVGDLPDVTYGDMLIDDVLINVSIASMPSGILGYGSVEELRQDGDFLPYLGKIGIDPSVLSRGVTENNQEGGNINNSMVYLIAHEVAHAMGFSTMWGGKQLNTVFGQYTGENALEVYRDMMGDTSLTYVPLETGGGPGTINAHWAEDIFGAELMTGWLNSPVLSKLTVAGFEDLGYEVSYAAAEPYTPLNVPALAPLVDVAFTGQTSAQFGHYVI